MSIPRRHSVCPNCGAINMGEQTTCLRCQAPLVEQVPLVRKADAPFAATCPNCSVEVVPGYKFCIACGASLERAAMAEQGSAIPAGDAILITSGWQLTIADGPNAGQSFSLGDRVRLGRKADNEICLADRRVSRHHAVLERVGHGYLITDQGSSNGTYVNGVRISQPTLLRSGDTITIGDTQLTVLGEAGNERSMLPPTGTEEAIICPACGARIASRSSVRSAALDWARKEIMETIFRLIAFLGAVFTAAMTVLMLFTFRKERRINAFSPFLSAVLSLVLLPVFILLSGARLNLLLAIPILALGLLIGFLRGLTTRLTYKDGQVVGRNSLLFLLGWGGSLVLAQLLNLFSSAFLASIGLVPVFLSTGTQVGMNGNVFLRRLMMRSPPPVPSVDRARLELPERARASSPPPTLPERAGGAAPAPPGLPERGREATPPGLPERKPRSDIG